MPFLLAEILNFQGSTHQYGVGSFSKLPYYPSPYPADTLLQHLEKCSLRILFPKYYNIFPFFFCDTKNTGYRKI